MHYVYPGRPGVRRPADSYFPTVEEERVRSASDNPHPSDRRRSPDFPRHTARPPQARRYSQPRVNPVIVSSDDEDGRMRPGRQHGSDPALHRLPRGRRDGPGLASPKRGYSPNLRAPTSEAGDRRKSFPFGDVKDKLMSTVTSMLSSSPGPRSSSRAGSHASSGHLRPEEYAGRREGVNSDSDSDYDSSERGRRRRREMERARERAQRAMDRERDLDRERDRDRDRDRERDGRGRGKERHPDVYDDRPLRPVPRRASPKRASPYRRGGLHPDAVPRREERDRDRDRDSYEGSRERVRLDRRRRDAYRD